MAEAILRILSGKSQQVDPMWLEQFTLAHAAQQYLDQDLRKTTVKSGL